MYSPIEHITMGIWLSRYSEENLVTTLSAGYFDAAGKNKGTGILAVAGIVAPVKKWIRFDHRWTEILAGEKINTFHMTDFASNKGEFKNWRGDTERRGRLWSRLMNLITQTANKMIFIAVELDGWEAANREYELAEKFHTPYSLCAFTAVLASLKWARNRKQVPIEFFFEDGDEGKDGLIKLCAPDRIEPIFRSKRLSALQAADILAWKARTVCRNASSLTQKIEDSREPDFASYDQILKELESFEKVKVRPNVAGIYSKEKLISACLKNRVARRLGPRLVNQA
jgi:hypothetical protein